MDTFKGDQHLPTNITLAMARLIFAHWGDDLYLGESGAGLSYQGFDPFSPSAWDSWISNHERNPAFASELVPSDFSGADPIIDESGSAPFDYIASAPNDVLGQFATDVDRTDPHEFQFTSGGGLATAAVSNMVVQTDFDLNGLRDFQIVIAGTNAVSADIVF
jgi:hypothetical protein